MPLLHSSSKSALRTNMRTLDEDIGKSPHVKSRAQAIAIALNTQREARKKGRKKGGRIHFDIGGFANPNAAPVSGPPMPTGGLGAAMPPPPPPSPPTGSYSPPPAQPEPPPAPGFGTPDAGGGAWGNSAPPYGGIGRFGLGPPGNPSYVNAIPLWYPGAGGMGGFGGFPGAGSGAMGSKDGGGIQRLALGGPPAPWFVRNEARGMMHTGPIPSIVPGRTDRHGMKVPSGSYVLPADHVSSLGQGNTQAGYAVLNRMFHSGPFGAGAPKMGHGSLPRPPKLQGVMTSQGGGRGHDVGSPVEVVTAGGEYVVPPHVVAAIGGGNVDHGHKVLDMWVKSNREKHIKTLKKLPGPAKS